MKTRIIALKYLKVLTFMLFFSSPGDLVAQDDKKEIRSGTNRYEQGKYADAELDFRKALEKSSTSYAGSYNLGNALYRQDKQEEATARFAEAAEKATDPATKARAFHNLGNAHVKSGKYAEAVEAYKKSLRLNPSDNDTRYNLAYAQSLLKNQQNQENRNNDQNQQQDKNQKNEQQNQQQNQQQKDGQQKQNDQQQSGDEKKQEGKDAKQQQQPRISKEDAERILQALKQNEQELNKKLSKKEGVRVNVEKNW